MTLANAAVRWATLVLLCGCWIGCSPLGERGRDEEKDPNYLTGKNRVAALDHLGAIDAFERALAADPRSAAAHLELGLIHQQYLATNWARAIYHFEKYLELRPKANNADLIRQRIAQCKLELAKEVPFAAVNQQMQRELEKMDRLNRENADLRQQVEQLKAQLAQRPGSASGGVTALNPTSLPGTRPLVSAQAASNPGAQFAQAVDRPASLDPARDITRASATTKTHVVKNGEWPYSIARTYGIKVADLLSANPGMDPRRLRPGQALVIPSS
jgi:tetratricopeptide (TPR) repeat protein